MTPTQDELGVPDGPPLTPKQRARARARRRAMVGVLVGLLALVGVSAAVVFALAGVGALSPDDQHAEQAAEEPTDDAEQVPEIADLDIPEVGDSDQIELVDPEDYDGVTREHLRLLVDIDASERAMIGFQLAISGSLLDPDEVAERITQAAIDAQDSLADLRLRLQRSLSDPAAAETRDRYIVHLDAWVAWLEHIEDNPMSVLDDNPRFTVPVNATGDAFVRALDEMLEGDDVDEEVRRIADAIVERGFPGPSESQV